MASPRRLPRRQASASAWLARHGGWATAGEIAAEAGVSYRTTLRALAELDAAGRLEITATWPRQYRATLPGEGR